MLPAAGQGIVAIECLRGNESIAREINHPPTESAALRERGVLQKFGTQLDCYSAVAVHDDGRTLRAFFSNGTRSIRATGASVDEVYDSLIAQGAEELL
jgi:porphobilinogen deaminase